MANLKEIRIRISSVSSTMQITSAMKMVSAAKLKKATELDIKIINEIQFFKEIENVMKDKELLEGINQRTLKWKPSTIL